MSENWPGKYSVKSYTKENNDLPLPVVLVPVESEKKDVGWGDEFPWQVGECKHIVEGTEFAFQSSVRNFSHRNTRGRASLDKSSTSLHRKWNYV